MKKKRRFTSVTRILFSHNVWLQPINWRTLNYTHPSHCQHICIEYNTTTKKSIDLFVNRNIRNDYFALNQVKHNDKNEKNKNFLWRKYVKNERKKPTKRTNNGPWILFSCRHHVVIIIIKYNDEKKNEPSLLYFYSFEHCSSHCENFYRNDSNWNMSRKEERQRKRTTVIIIKIPMKIQSCKKSDKTPKKIHVESFEWERKKWIEVVVTRRDAWKINANFFVTCIIIGALCQVAGMQDNKSSAYLMFISSLSWPNLSQIIWLCFLYFDHTADR